MTFLIWFVQPVRVNGVKVYTENVDKRQVIMDLEIRWAVILLNPPLYRENDLMQSWEMKLEVKLYCDLCFVCFQFCWKYRDRRGYKEILLQSRNQKHTGKRWFVKTHLQYT